MSSPHHPAIQFEQFLEQTLAADPVARAAYEDAHSRSSLVDALVSFRHRLKMTQTQVAAAMGVKQPTISGFETEGSDPRLSTLQRYARAVDAVLVVSVHPRTGPSATTNYVEKTRVVSASTNTNEPTQRALAWTPQKPYVDRDDERNTA